MFVLMVLPIEMGFVLMLTNVPKCMEHATMDNVIIQSDHTHADVTQDFNLVKN